MTTLAVFGASRGIGRSFVESAAENYSQIFLFDIAESIFDVRDNILSLDVKCEAFLLDVSDVTAMEQSFSTHLSAHKIDNVCYFIRDKNKPHFMDITSAEWDNELDITLKGAFFAVQKLRNYLSNNAAIIFVSSICAQLMGSETVSYHVSKAGIENLTKYLAKNMGDNIRVNAVRLGFIVQEEHEEFFYSDGNSDYRNLAHACHPLKRIGHVDDVTHAMNFLFSPQSSFITGHILNVDGGLSLSEQSHMVMSKSFYGK